jgi:hypothetical protein
MLSALIRIPALEGGLLFLTLILLAAILAILVADFRR